MSERIGVYICECGPNIKDALDIDAVLKYAADLEGVVLTKPFGLLCAEEGKAFVSQEIRDYGLTRVVFGACSPKEHEKTLKGFLKDLKAVCSAKEIKFGKFDVMFAE